MYAFIIALGLNFIFANAVAATKLPQKNSKMGNISGGSCNNTNDCMVGCIVSGEPTCIAKNEGSTKCLETKALGPGGLPCTCLADAKLCGFQFPGK